MSTVEPKSVKSLPMKDEGTSEHCMVTSTDIFRQSNSSVEWEKVSKGK